jgi:DNA-binding transcriptional MocR family regulator
MRGRKPKQESRSAEFRQSLISWKQTPESLRPSLRSLARMLGTSHQLLKHYLDGLEKWRYKERYNNATEESYQILARAIVEDRPMTQWEEQRRDACTLAAIRAKVGSLVLDDLAKLKHEASRGPLHPAQFKIVKIFAQQGFPGAQELLQKCSQVGLKKRKRFSEIVKETPRQEGETYIAWVRRIWDQCAKYDTNCPAVITEELLQKCSQGGANNQKNNLPPIFGGAAKSFRTVQGKAGKGWQLR